MIHDGAGRNALPRRKPGAEIRDSRIAIKQVPPGSPVQAAVSQNPTARSLRISNTTIVVDIDGTPGIRRGRPGAGGWIWRPSQDVPPKPHWTRLSDVTITGSSAEGPAISLQRADGSRLRNCHIDQPGAERNGVVIRDAVDVVLDGGRYRVGGFPVIVRNSNRRDESGCRLEFGAQPELSMLTKPEELSEYGSVSQGIPGGMDRPEGSSDEGVHCVIDGTEEALSGSSWQLRVAGIDGESLLGTVFD
jgi:hypothetical protein